MGREYGPSGLCPGRAFPVYNQYAPGSRKALCDRRELPVWISRGKYPHQSRQDWITRSWLLLRKVINQDGQPTANDVRVAKILLHHSPRVARCPEHLKKMLEEVIINGPTQLCAFCQASQEEAELGSRE